MNQLIKEFNRENLKPIIFIAAALFLLAATAYPQRKFGGKVVEVVDGKTAVIQVPTGGRVTVVLQFIEIPEREQQLYQTVKEHLEALVLGRTVEFLPRRLLSQGSVGQIFLGGVDISQQMLRDGAAWYALPEKAGQEARDMELYMATEAQAKAENRGVWGAENLKPAWEFRAEKRQLALEAERAKAEALEREIAEQKKKQAALVPVKPKFKPPIQQDLWSDVSQAAQMSQTDATGGLLRGAVGNSGVSYVMTSGNFYDFAGGDAKTRLESRSIYVTGDGQTVNGNGFVIGFLAVSEQFSFAESNNLIITADKQKLNFGKPYRLFRQTPIGAQEILMYKTDEKTLDKIARAKNLDVKIGAFSGKLDSGYQLCIKNLLAVTTN